MPGANSALEKPIARLNVVSSDYFPLLRIPLAQGRLWTPDETKRGAPLALINQTMARQIFDTVASRWVTESSRDPLILTAVTALLLLVAAIACLAPARRAASIDPIEAVRHE